MIYFIINSLVNFLNKGRLYQNRPGTSSFALCSRILDQSLAAWAANSDLSWWSRDSTTLITSWSWQGLERLSPDDVIKWKHFQRYWPFVRGIQRSPVKSPHKGQWRGALIFDDERLSKQPWGWWFETPSHPFWCHRNDVKECEMGYLEIVSCQWKTRNRTRMVDDIWVVLLIKWFNKNEVHVNKGIMRTLYVWLWFMNRQFCLINLSFKYCKDNAE